MHASWLLVPALLSFGNAVAVDARDELPALDARGGGNCPSVWTQVKGELNTLFMSGSQCNDLARAAIRAIFHDCGSWDTTQKFTGGCDGSLIVGTTPDVELDRGENRGLQTIAGVLKDLATKYKTSVADMIVFAGSMLHHSPMNKTKRHSADTYQIRLFSCVLADPRSRHSWAAKTTPPRPRTAVFLTYSPPLPTSSTYSLPRATRRQTWPRCLVPTAHRRRTLLTHPRRMLRRIPRRSYVAPILRLERYAEVILTLTFVHRPGQWDVNYYKETIDYAKTGTSPKGVFVFPSDAKLSQYSDVGKEFSGLVGNLGKWQSAFANA
jgi:hypothetical protein